MWQGRQAQLTNNLGKRYLPVKRPLPLKFCGFCGYWYLFSLSKTLKPHAKPLDIQFIYFDLDDTLLDHHSAQEAALEDVFNHYTLFEENGVTYSIFKEKYAGVNKKLWLAYAQHKIERPYLQFHRFYDTLEALSFNSVNDLDALSKEMGEYYIGQYADHWRWMDGAEEAFNQIRQNFPIGLMTNGFAETQRKKCKRFDLYDKSEELVIAEEVGYMKPQPEIFRHATEKSGYEPQHIRFVGDSYHDDIQGAHPHGWKTAWYNPKNKSPEDNPPVADFTFSDFDELVTWLNNQK